MFLEAARFEGGNLMMEQIFIANRFKSKKLITQLFTVLVGFSGILMLVVSIVVSHQTTTTFINNNNLVYSNTLKVSTRTMDALFAGYHDSLTHITYDANIIDFVVTPKPRSSASNNRVWSVLSGYCQENEAIQEVYLYVQKTNQILSSTYKTSTLEYFQEKELIVNHMTNAPATTLLKSGRTSSIVMYKKHIYIVRDFPLNGEKRLGTLFMKINPSALYHNSLDGSQTSYSSILAYDDAWNPLFPELLDYQALATEVAAALPLMKEEQPNTTYINGQHYYLHTAELSHINLLLAVNDSAFIPSMQIVMQNSFPFFALILVLSGLLTICILYLSYMPVLRLTRLVSAAEESEDEYREEFPQEYPEHGKEENEWHYLTKRFLSISDKKQQLDHILNHMIPKISREFYFELLNGKPMEQQYIRNLLTNTKSPLKAEGKYEVAAITFAETLDEPKKTQILDTLCHVLNEDMEKICHYVTQPIDESLYAIIIQFESSTPAHQITDLEIRLEQAFYNSFPGQHQLAWFEIGPKCTSLQNISVSYVECLQRLALKKYPDKQALPAPKKTPDDSIIPDYQYFQLQLKSIAGFLLVEDISSAAQKARQICLTVWQGNFREDTQKAYGYYRVAFLNMLAAYNITGTTQEELAFIFQNDAFVAAQLAEDDELLLYMEHFCDGAIHLWAEKIQKQQHKYLVKVRHYIENNFDNPDLSLNLLAEQCNTTTSYLSRLFKDSFGINFIEYLNQYRIDKAKELLESEQSVKEVAITTGFNSQQNFIRVFKKYTGVTPGQYKSQKML